MTAAESVALAERVSMAGQRAIVTGAAGSVGRAVTAELTSRGVTVVGLDARPGADHVVDLRRADEVAATLDAVVAVAPVQIVVHCAAIALEHRLEDTTPEEWDAVLGANAGGAFHLFRAVFPHLRARGYGRVVAIGSIASQFGYAFPAYSASKAAVLALVKSAAVQYASSGITVNCVSPGRIATPLAPHSSEAQLRERVPVGRAARPEEVAAVVAAVAEPACSYLTGADIVCDGGMSSVFALHGLGPYDPWSPHP